MKAKRGEVGIVEGHAIHTREGTKVGPCFVSPEAFFGPQIKSLLAEGRARIAQEGDGLETLKREPVMRARSAANAFDPDHLETLTLSKLNELAAEQSETRPMVYTSRAEAIEGLSQNFQEGEADELFHYRSK